MAAKKGIGRTKRTTGKKAAKREPQGCWIEVGMQVQAFLDGCGEYGVVVSLATDACTVRFDRPERLNVPVEALILWEHINVPAEGPANGSHLERALAIRFSQPTPTDPAGLVNELLALQRLAMLVEERIETFADDDDFARVSKGFNIVFQKLEEMIFGATYSSAQRLLGKAKTDAA